MLTDIQCRNAMARPRPYKISDGAGLHLVVTPIGSKLWRLAYRFEHRQKSISFGPYPTVSIAMARYACSAARLYLQSGFDPSNYRQHIKREMRKPRLMRHGVPPSHFNQE